VLLSGPRISHWHYGNLVGQSGNIENEILHDRTGVDRIPNRELNDSVTQQWQNGDTELLPQDKALIQGTSLPQLMQTSQDHKLAWLAQTRLARLAYASIEDGDESTDIDSDMSETTHDP
jgi:hypothetical protein